jgi:hypothetical protein
MPKLRDQRANNVRYYAANREQEIQRVRRRQEATTAFLRELRDVPCTDCGGRFVPHQMDFDHRDPSQKTFTLCSSRAALKNRHQILLEAQSATSSAQTVIGFGADDAIGNGSQHERRRCRRGSMTSVRAGVIVLIFSTNFGLFPVPAVGSLRAVFDGLRSSGCVNEDQIGHQRQH